MVRFLGIDYGKKRIGLSISDELGGLAFPKMVLANDGGLFQKLDSFLKENSISEIVVGYSTDSSGQRNKIQEDIDMFCSSLIDRFNLPIHFQKEFFTSLESEKKEGKEVNVARKIKKIFQKKNDAVAAALILQRYLDHRSKKLNY